MFGLVWSGLIPIQYSNSNVMKYFSLINNQVPNGVGGVLGIIQLALYTYYSRISGQESREPLLVSYA